MKKQTTLILAAIVIVIIVAIALSRHSASPVENNTTNQQVATTSTTSAAVTQPVSSTTSSVSPTVKSFTVVGSNYAFSPKTLEVNKGDTVKITFTNSGGMHDFKIDEFSVAAERLESGDSTTVQFVADKSGTFQYYCSVGTHRAMGMWGTLTVK